MEKKMKNVVPYQLISLMILSVLFLAAGILFAADDQLWQQRQVEVSLGGAFKIVSVREPVGSLTGPQTKGLKSSPFDGLAAPPLAGFSPLIVMAASNKGDRYGDSYEHQLESHYNTGRDLNYPVEQNFIIGIYDSGAVLDLVAWPSAVKMGLTKRLTDNTFPLGGVGGQLDADLTWPVGIFAGGLQAINPNGHIDPNYLVGHSNVSVAVTPEISCGNGESITGVVGTPFVSFYTAVIKNDERITAIVDGQKVSGPRIDILQPGDPAIPEYPRSISIQLGGISMVTTASFYPDIMDIFSGEPYFPTMLSMSGLSIPFGGAFFAEIGVVHGEPGPLNPIQTMRVMVDTGAQSSIMSPGMAAKLSLPRDPDFTVSVCGVGGLQEDVPVYNIDYVRMNAWGGAMEFTKAPFVILDLGSPDGLPLDGVLGMNFFWNRNIVFEPSLLGDGFIHVSDPVAYADADFNGDGQVNMADFAVFAESWLTTSSDQGYHPECDVYLDDSVNMNDFIQLADKWLNGISF